MDSLGNLLRTKVVQVMLVGGVVKGRPRASITAPWENTIPFDGVNTQFSTEQMSSLDGLLINTVASMKAGDLAHGQQAPVES
jgi:hypothetical protein